MKVVKIQPTRERAMMQEVIIDVREKDEFLAEHIEHSIHIPLTDFSTQAPGILKQLVHKKLVFMCRGGNRAKLAYQSMRDFGIEFTHAPEVYAGGIMQWKENGNPTVQLVAQNKLPLMRQVQLAAGALILIFFTLSLLVSKFFVLGMVFVGAGLTFAGLTGFCGMAILLNKMPWNNVTCKTTCYNNKLENSQADI